MPQSDLFSIFDISTSGWAIEARLLRWLTLFWVVLGLAVLYSASYSVGIAEAGDGLRYFKIQVLWVCLGLVGLNAIVHIPLRYLLRLAGFGVIVLLGLILVTLTPALGVTVNGATRWLSLGPFLIQPSELIKPFLILQAAYLFGQWRSHSWRVRLFWLSAFLVLIGAILTQPNLSTAAVCGMSLWLIALAAGLPYWQLGYTALGGLSVGLLSISIKDYQRQRVISFLDPWADPTGHGYQLIQSLLAIGSGGLWGAGFGLSQQKLFYLPIQYTDFIFAVYAEEFGFVGSISLVLLLAVYATLAFWVTLKTKQRVHRLVAVGAMVFLVGQSLLNIGVASGALPTTGLPFPLFSYGGSSMISSLLTAALLIRVARESREAVVVPIGQKRNLPSLISVE
ncbi:MAG: FtsW/RodA/SpoVE family cell cycle protein [Cyanobacteria bacterium P01_A01_bin.123]